MRDTIEARGGGLDRRGLSTTLLLLAAAIAAAPIWLHRTSCGDDLQFHLLSWFDALGSWRHGAPYPHWTPSANYGAGEPRFIFYPPLTWMLGAALATALPWTWVPAAMLFVLFGATGVGVRAFAAPLLPPAFAALAGLAAILCVYPLYTAYDRAAFGELAGGLWIPLLLLFASEGSLARGSVCRSRIDRSTPCLALAVAGCWLSDAPVGVMGIYLLAAVALALAALSRSWAPMLRAAIAGALGIGLAGFYIIPAAWELRWVNVRKASGTGDPGLAIEQNWLFGHSADPRLRAHEAGLHYVSWLAVAMLTVTAAAMLVVWLRRPAAEARQRRIWLVLACIPAAVLLLQLPPSKPLWNLLPKLRFLQFPWRWLLVLETPMAVFLAAAVRPATSSRRAHRIAGMLLFCTILSASLIYIDRTAFRQQCSAEELPPHLLAQLRAGSGSWGADEYEPIGTDITLIPSGLPDLCLTDDTGADLATSSPTDAAPVWNPSERTCLATAQATVRSPDHLRITATSASGGYAVLRLQNYPAWRVRVNGQPVPNLLWREDGLISLPIPAGTVAISVDWVTTPDVIAGRLASLTSAAALILLWWQARRQTHKAPAPSEEETGAGIHD